MDETHLIEFSNTYISGNFKGVSYIHFKISDKYITDNIFIFNDYIILKFKEDFKYDFKIIAEFDIYFQTDSSIDNILIYFNYNDIIGPKVSNTLDCNINYKNCNCIEQKCKISLESMSYIPNNKNQYLGIYPVIKINNKITQFKSSITNFKLYVQI